MRALRYLTTDKFSIMDGVIFGIAGHLMFTDRVAQAVATVVFGILVSAVLTAVVKVFGPNQAEAGKP